MVHFAIFYHCISWCQQCEHSAICIQEHVTVVGGHHKRVPGGSIFFRPFISHGWYTTWGPHIWLLRTHTPSRYGAMLVLLQHSGMLHMARLICSYSSILRSASSSTSTKSTSTSLELAHLSVGISTWTKQLLHWAVIAKVLKTNTTTVFVSFKTYSCRNS